MRGNDNQKGFNLSSPRRRGPTASCKNKDVLLAGDMPLAKAFRLVQAVVSEFDEILCGSITDAAGDTGREGHAPQRRDKLPTHGTGQAFHGRLSLLPRRLRQHEQELVPTIAKHEVGGTRNLADASREDPQEAVPLPMAKIVVDCLE